MSLFELFIIAVGLSMDAFAVAVSMGLSMKKSNFKNAVCVGLYFGVFQGLMPLIGYFIGVQFSDVVKAFDHWIAFALLIIIGGKMAVESFKKEGCPDRACPETPCTDRECPVRLNEKEEGKMLSPLKMLPFAVATSIDALAVGVSFAFLSVRIVPAVSFIGIITFTLSVIGVKIGGVFGTKFKSKAELAGGIILMLIGIKILLEHLNVISF